LEIVGTGSTPGEVIVSAGTDRARHGLARKLTLVAFRPDNTATHRGHE